ncbi:hypothetical protein ACFX2H_012790 [Malus domestica]
MARKLNALAVFLFLLSTSNAKAELGVFDVTSATYGAKPGSDITQALAKAWTDACASPTTSKVVVPSGTYKLTEASFKGPCKAPIEIQVHGKLQAPADGGKLTKPDTWVAFEHINMLTIYGGGTFNGQGALAWKLNDCNKNKDCKSIAINMRFNFVTNSTIQDITSLDSKNFHVNILGCHNVTFQHVNVTAPGESINTDGIHIGRSTGINITDAHIGTGDDCVSIGDGSKEITITRVTCGPGHGISVGSLGRYPNEEPVVGIRVRNCTLTNTSNGVRIKTWPASPSDGIASDMHFEDIIVVNVSNPILIDQQYCPWNQCKQNIPSKVKISNVSFKNIKGSSATPFAIQIICSRGLPCENVELSDIDLTYSGNKGTLNSQCSNVKPTITRVLKALACATSS